MSKSPDCNHFWVEKKKARDHAYTFQTIVYFKCTKCKQVGFRIRGKGLLYTWERIT